MRQQAPTLSQHQVRIIDLLPAAANERSEDLALISPGVSAVLFPGDYFKIAKAFWQHSGDGISSRRAEYCHSLFTKGSLVDASTLENGYGKGPRRYQKKPSVDAMNGASEKLNALKEAQDPTDFVEERFGRNLNLSLTKNAKLAVRRRIAGSLTADVELYPCGMSAIYNAHRNLMALKGQLKSIVTARFPYIDTLKITEKFGPGSLFYGFGSAEELDDLEKRLEGGERFLALFTEFPGNPLLQSPDLERIRSLAEKYDIYVVIDETIGNFLNVNVLPYADVVVSSLTKVFSGDSNVMGGRYVKRTKTRGESFLVLIVASLVLNPKAKSYETLKSVWSRDYVDHHWAEDSIVLERNSRDFVSRIARINANAEAICEVLLAHPRVKQVNYPKCSSTKSLYDKCRNPDGGYGGLLSITFHAKHDAIAFFDNLDTVKGPSLGTNFTLSSPYVVLAHYGELDWAASWGVEADLVRVSVGLEETSKLKQVFQRALDAMMSDQ